MRTNPVELVHTRRGRAGLRWAAIGATGVALAIGGALWVRAPQAPAAGVTIEVRSSRLALDGEHVTGAVVGDEVTIGAPHGAAIWLYRDTSLVAQCQRACDRIGGGVGLRYRVRAPGRFRVLVLTGVEDLEPTGSFERDVVRARGHGAELELRVIVASP